MVMIWRDDIVLTASFIGPRMGSGITERKNMKLGFPVRHPILKTVAAIFILAMSAKAQEASARLENRALRAELNLSSHNSPR
jgi:hypothetical protein